MSQSDNKLYEFGAFRLDTAERVLWHDEELLVLPSKVFDTLLMLVKSEGRVVSKSELMEAIWADAFVEESNLSQNIYTLRRTLGVDEEGRQFIETVPRRGYRFAASVRILNTNEITTENEKQTSGVSFSHTDASSGTFSTENNLTHSVPYQTNDSQTLAETQTPLLSSSLQKKSEVRTTSASRYRLWIGLGVLIVFLLLGVAIYQFVFQRAKNSKATIAPIEQLRFQRLTDSGDVVFPTISPNGELLAYVRLEEEEGSVWVKQIATGSTVQTLPPSSKGYRSLAFSPDGRYLYFREEADGSAIYQTTVFGSTPKKVADNVWSDFSVSPDGKQFVFTRRDTQRRAHLLILSDTDGSGERELSSRNAPLDYRATPAWSPDGRTLVAVAGVQDRIFPKLVTVDASTGKERELQTPHWRAISRALWTPNGKHLIVSARETNESSSQLWMIAYPDGEVRRLTNDLESYFWLSLSADGRMLVTRQQRITSHLWLLTDGDLKKAKQLTFGGRSFDGYVGLAWTRDGKILFSSLAGNITDLYSMNIDGSNRIQLTANAGQDNTYPTVSRDGRYVVFTSNRTGTTQIWRMDIDGRNQKQLTFDEGRTEREQSAVLSPDGTEVFFIKRGVNPAAIWKISIEGGNPVQVSRLTNATTEVFLSISPDGKWLAYRHVSTEPETGNDDSMLKIGILPTDGNAEPKLFDLQMRRPMIQWTDDSSAFDYSVGTFNSSGIWRQSLNKSKTQKLFDFPDRVFNFAWSDDGKHLVLARGKQQGDAILITNLP